MTINDIFTGLGIHCTVSILFLGTVLLSYKKKTCCKTVCCVTPVAFLHLLCHVTLDCVISPCA